MITREFTRAYNAVNEDVYCIEELNDGRILICVADGMGGLALGDRCAECACKGVTEYIRLNSGVTKVDWTAAFSYADSKIRALSIECKSNMGTTLSSIILDNSTCSIAWQGNVRIYLLRDSLLKQVTTDHVMDIGYGKKKISRCLKGGGLREEVPETSLDTREGDILYICTDGFYEKYENLLSSDEDINMAIPLADSPDDDVTCIQVIL